MGSGSKHPRHVVANRTYGDEDASIHHYIAHR